MHHCAGSVGGTEVDILTFRQARLVDILTCRQAPLKDCRAANETRGHRYADASHCRGDHGITTIQREFNAPAPPVKPAQRVSVE